MASILGDGWCGNDTSFWNRTQSWDAQNPDFSRCFVRSACVWIPLGFEALFGALELSWMRLLMRRRGSSPNAEKRPPSLPPSALFRARMAVTLLLLVLCLMQYGLEEVWRTWSERSLVDHLYLPSVLLLLLGNVLLRALARRWGQTTSYFQLSFWIVVLVCWTPATKMNVDVLIEDRTTHDWHWLAAIAGLCQTLMMLVLLLLELRSDAEISHEGDSEELASAASILTFSWMDGLIKKGFSRHVPLTTLDFPETRSGVRCESILESFETSKAGTRSGNVLAVLAKAFASTVLMSIVLKLCSDLLNQATPQLLRLFIRALPVDQPDWHSYFWAVVIFANVTLQVTLSNQVFRLTYTGGFQMRTATLLAVYKKGLLLSPADRARYTTGEITNLMAVDCQRFMDAAPFANMTWAAPLQLTLASYFLYQLVGVSSLIGLGVMALLVPVNFVISAKLKQLQARQNTARDKRLRLLNEVLQGIKVLKLYAWDAMFYDKLVASREEEVSCLRGFGTGVGPMRATFRFSSFLMTVVMFAALVLLLNPEGESLTAENIFASIALVNIVRYPLFHLSNVIMHMMRLALSVKRINQFLTCKEVKGKGGGDSGVSFEDSDNLIEFRHSNLSWGENDESKAGLKNLNISIQEGSLTAVLGKVGSGKSSLLSAILGEMTVQSGTVSQRGSIAYVPQQAWIQNMTLKDNILFGRDFDQWCYSKVLEATTLVDDLTMLPAGDLTQIGEKGINLSGGQKQRVSLARAAYSQADLILLDDPLSAVDATVGEHLFKELICGLMGTKTRVVVTHNLSFLADMDRILLLEDGHVVADGTYAELSSGSEKFKHYIKQASIMEKETEEKKLKRVATRQHLKAALASGGKIADGTDIVKDEKMERGTVDFRHYSYYLARVGRLYFLTSILLTLVAFYLENAGAIVLSDWADAVKKREDDMAVNVRLKHFTADEHLSFIKYLAICYTLSWVFAVISPVIMFLRFAACSRVVHMSALKGVMHSSMSFFDSNPCGRILNRFSSDLDVLDVRLPMEIFDITECACGLVAVLTVIAYQAPWILAVLAAVLSLALVFRAYYARTKRQLKRLESIGRSPILAHFSETVQGTGVIRAYGEEMRFLAENRQRVHNHLGCGYMNDMSFRWLGLRMDHLGNLIVLSTALLVAGLRGSMSVGMGSLLLTISTPLVDRNSWFVRMMCEAEADSVVLERLREYEELPEEAEWYTKNISPGVPDIEGWPKNGSISFMNYSVKYRPELEDVIQNLTLKIESGERLGVCGRTGAGKSTLTLALFRILEPSGGSVTIAGRDLTTIGLQDLRSQITIIPQDPVMFSGTLRMNLDPTDSFSDKEIWDALSHAQLTSFVGALDNGLQHEVVEGGSTFSAGQRQLVCLARALLRKTQILVLDEATASMDAVTDAALQATLANEFVGCTVITIAHRLDTIIGYDRILVMSEGTAKECDTPQNLMNNMQTDFYQMCLSAGIIKE